MKIYTKTGDLGKTSLWGGHRVDKNAVRVTAYGTVDELNAILGVVRAHGVDATLDTSLARIQNQLFVLGGDLASPSDSATTKRMSEEHIVQLEQEIDQFESELEPLRQFILPGGVPTAAYLHMARTICRRAERHVVTLANQEPINQATMSYLNRLSDWLFVLARVANTRAGMHDIPVTYT